MRCNRTLALTDRLNKEPRQTVTYSNVAFVILLGPMKFSPGTVTFANVHLFLITMVAVMYRQ